MGDICSNAGSNKYQRKGIKLILTNLPILLYFYPCPWHNGHNLGQCHTHYPGGETRTQTLSTMQGYVYWSALSQAQNWSNLTITHLKQNSYILMFCWQYFFFANYKVFLSQKYPRGFSLSKKTPSRESSRVSSGSIFL